MGVSNEQALAEALDSARYVRYHGDYGLLFVWFGGEAITVFNLAGEATDQWSMSGTHWAEGASYPTYKNGADVPSIHEVIDSIRDHIEKLESGEEENENDRQE